MAEKSIQQLQEEVILEFQFFDDWMDKYNYLIELSRDLPPIEDRYKTNEYLIQGCQSRVWLHADMKNGLLEFRADSDAIITKGIIALLVRLLSGRKPEEVKDADLYFIDKIGLKENLSPTRANGLLAMMKQMKLYALAYHTKMNS